MTLLLLAVAFLGGIVLGARSDVPSHALGLFALALVLLSALLLVSRRSPLPTLLLAVLVLGMLRVELSGDAASALDAYHRENTVLLQGVVASDPEASGPATRFRLEVDLIERGSEWSIVSGVSLVTLRESGDLAPGRNVRYGDRLLLEGPLRAPPALEGFDYPAYLARQGIGSVMSFPTATLLNKGEGISLYRWLYSVRRRMAESIAEAVPEPQASLGQALVLGLRQDLPEDLVEKFRATGTSHLLAISGLHVGILLGLSLAASAWAFGRRRQLYLVAPLVMVWLYAFMAGMTPSVARAAIMASVYLAAMALGRPRSVLPALGLAAGP
jgi:competence protein ComEC